MTAVLQYLKETGVIRTMIALAVAFGLGTAIGLERQLRQRAAGLRTTVLVACGAAGFADLGMQLNGAPGAGQLIAYIISGIGFLGAGVIMKDGASVRGLNTAATLWCAAAVGAFCGAGQLPEAFVVTGFVLAANTLLRPLVQWVDRRPLQTGGTEAEYQVRVICDLHDVTDVRRLLQLKANAAGYPIGDVEMTVAAGETVELEATLIPHTAEPQELDRMVAAIETAPGVRRASWSVSAFSG